MNTTLRGCRCFRIINSNDTLRICHRPYWWLTFKRNHSGCTITKEKPWKANSVSSLHTKEINVTNVPQRIVFGSCSSQNGDLSYWDRIIEQTPDLIVLMGDNVYPPTINKNLDRIRTATKATESTMSAAYETLASNPNYIRAVNTRTPIIATLDDNDYNLRYYQHGKNSQHPKMIMEDIHSGLEITKHDFLRFFRIDSSDVRWTDSGRGVYTSYDYVSYENGSVDIRCSTNRIKHTGDDSSSNYSVNNSVYGKVLWRLQIILLDVRRHKSPFALQDTFNSNDEKCTGPYIPSHDKNRTMLGACQWKWLEEQLKYDAPTLPVSNTTMNCIENRDYDKCSMNKEPNLRIVVSPIQVLSDGLHGWDCWSLFPHERDRLLALLSRQSPTSETALSSTVPTVLLSGDRHVAGFYKQNLPSKPPYDKIKHSLTEVTSSSLTHTVPRGLLDHEIDTKRVGNFIYGNNFGVLQINNNNSTKTTENANTKDEAVTVTIHCTKTGTVLDSTTIKF